MTTDEIRRKIQDVYNNRHDNEEAHMIEDDLLVDFIEYVSQTGGSLALKAREVLKVRQIDYTRWYA